MAESHVGVAPDGSGKAIDATTEATADGTVYRQRVSVGGVGNDNALAIDAAGKIGVNNFPATQPVSAAALPLPTGASTEATLALIKAKTDNIDVAVSTRTKPADSQHVTVDNAAVAVSGTFFQVTQPVSAASLPLPTGASTAAKQPALGTAGAASADVLSVQGVASMTPLKVDGSAVTQPVSGTVTTNPPANASENIAQIGGVAAPAPTAKGTQGATALATQDLKDAGRTAITLFLDAVTGITTEALATMSISKGGVAQTAAASYTVTAGKTFRISGVHTTVKNTSTVASDSRVRVRQAASGLTVASPIVLMNEAGSPAAIAQAAGTDDTVMPDGYEIAGGQQVGISHLESATTCTISVMVVGYEY